jgi:DNA-binding transcriptional MocR family regulator
MTPSDPSSFERLSRSPSLTIRVEQLLRDAIARGQFPGGKLPTEVQLAEQLGVSRETVRLAAGNLQREGLLVKIRRRGTLLRGPELPDQLPASGPGLIAYLQAGYQAPSGQPEPATRSISGLLLQGAVEEAARVGLHRFNRGCGTWSTP